MRPVLWGTMHAYSMQRMKWRLVPFEGAIKFLDIYDIIEEDDAQAKCILEPTLDELLQDRWARAFAATPADR